MPPKTKGRPQYFYPPELKTPLAEGIEVFKHMSYVIKNTFSLSSAGAPESKILHILEHIGSLYRTFGSIDISHITSILGFFKVSPLDKENPRQYILTLQSQFTEDGSHPLDQLLPFSPIAVAVLKHEVKIFGKDSSHSPIINMLTDLENHSQILSSLLPQVSEAISRFKEKLEERDKSEQDTTKKILKIIEAADGVIIKLDEIYPLFPDFTASISERVKSLYTPMHILGLTGKYTVSKKSLDKLQAAIKLSPQEILDAETARKIQKLISSFSLTAEHIKTLAEELGQTATSDAGLLLLEHRAATDKRYSEPMRRDIEAEQNEAYQKYMRNNTESLRAAYEDYLSTEGVDDCTTALRDFIDDHHKKFLMDSNIELQKQYSLNLAHHYLKIYRVVTDERALADTNQNVIHDMTSRGNNMLYLLFKESRGSFELLINKLPKGILFVILKSRFCEQDHSVLDGLLTRHESEEIVKSIFTHCSTSDLLELVTSSIRYHSKQNSFKQLKLQPEISKIILERLEEEGSIGKLSSNLEFFENSFKADPEFTIHCAIKAGILRKFLAVEIGGKPIKEHITTSKTLTDCCKEELSPDNYKKFFESPHHHRSLGDGSNSQKDSTSHQLKSYKSCANLLSALAEEGVIVIPEMDEGIYSNKASPESQRKDASHHDILAAGTLDTTDAEVFV